MDTKSACRNPTSETTFLWNCPRQHLLGSTRTIGQGTPPQMLEMISRGVDMFDCVMPTRVARHGMAFTLDGPIHIKNKRFEFDSNPLDESTHPSLLKYSRSFIRHLFRSGEMLSLRLLSLHNLHFFLRLMSDAREHITTGTFSSFKN